MPPTSPLAGPRTSLATAALGVVAMSLGGMAVSPHGHRFSAACLAPWQGTTFGSLVGYGEPLVSEFSPDFVTASSIPP